MRDVINDDRGMDVMRIIRLNLGVGGEDVVVEVFIEVLDYVVVFGFIVDVDIEVKFVLDGDGEVDFFFDEVVVFFGGDFVFCEFVVLDVNFVGLGEGINGGGGEEGKVEVFFLLSIVGVEIGFVVVLFRSDGSLVFFDFGVVGVGGFGMSFDGGGVGI